MPLFDESIESVSRIDLPFQHQNDLVEKFNFQGIYRSVWALYVKSQNSDEENGIVLDKS